MTNDYVVLDRSTGICAPVRDIYEARRLSNAGDEVFELVQVEAGQLDDAIEEAAEAKR
jgi:hypothetical protein